MSTLILLAPLFLLPFFTPTVHAIISNTYQLDTHLSGQTFFDGFDFFTVSLSFHSPPPNKICLNPKPALLSSNLSSYSFTHSHLHLPQGSDPTHGFVTYLSPLLSPLNSQPNILQIPQRHHSLNPRPNIHRPKWRRLHGRRPLHDPKPEWTRAGKCADQ